MRKVELKMHEEFDDGGVENRAGFCEGIGHLVLWAWFNDRYQNLLLFVDRHGDLHATYRDAGGNITYTILGQRQEDGTYSFHS